MTKAAAVMLKLSSVVKSTTKMLDAGTLRGLFDSLKTHGFAKNELKPQAINMLTEMANPSVGKLVVGGPAPATGWLPKTRKFFSDNIKPLFTGSN